MKIKVGRILPFWVGLTLCGIVAVGQVLAHGDENHGDAAATSTMASSAPTPPDEHNVSGDDHDREDQEQSHATGEEDHHADELGAHAHEGHTHADAESSLDAAVAYAGKFHVVLVHFPIALTLAAFLAELLALATSAARRDFFRHAGRFMINLGALSVLVVAPLGWARAAFSSYSGTLADYLFWHRWLGTSTMILVIIAAILNERAHRSDDRDRSAARRGYYILLLVATLLMILTGHLGGSLVFGPGYY